MTIRNKITLFIASILVVVIAMCGLRSYDAWNKRVAAENVVKLAELNQTLLNGLFAARYEKSSTATILTAPLATLDSETKVYKDRRENTDQFLKNLPKANALSLSEPGIRAYGEFQNQYNKWRVLSGDLDTYTEKPTPGAKSSLEGK